jgi:hypothetical protein
MTATRKTTRCYGLRGHGSALDPSGIGEGA